MMIEKKYHATKTIGANMTNTKQLIAALSIASLMGAAGTSSWQPSKQRGSRGRVNTHTKDSKAKRKQKAKQRVSGQRRAGIRK